MPADEYISKEQFNDLLRSIFLHRCADKMGFQNAWNNPEPQTFYVAGEPEGAVILKVVKTDIHLSCEVNEPTEFNPFEEAYPVNCEGSLYPPREPGGTDGAGLMSPQMINNLAFILTNEWLTENEYEEAKNQASAEYRGTYKW